MVFKRDAKGVTVLCEDNGTVEMLVETTDLSCRWVVRRIDGCVRREAFRFFPFEELTEVMILLIDLL